MIVPVKRAAPYLLFAGVTLAVFWRFIAFGHTMHAMSAVESQLGQPVQEARRWFQSSLRHNRISDNVVVLAGHLRRYNEGLKGNELRLWNPSLFCGFPAYADPMLHPFYPPNLLLHRLFAPDTAYELGLMLHLFFSGVAMYLLLRAAGRSELAASGGGLVWMLAGYNAMWFSTGILLGATVFGPLALLAIVKGLETRDQRCAGWAGAAMGLAILGTHPQHAMLLFLLLLGWIAAAGPRPFSLRFGALFALLSIGVGMAEILTRLDTIENGYRDPEFDRLSLYAEPGRLATYVSGLSSARSTTQARAGKASLQSTAASGPRGSPSSGPSADGRIAAFDTPRSRRGRHGARLLLPVRMDLLEDPDAQPEPPFPMPVRDGLFGRVARRARAGCARRRPRPGSARIRLGHGRFRRLAVVGIGPATLSNGAAIETALGFALVTGAAFTARRWKRAAAALAFAALLFELLPPFLQFNAHSTRACWPGFPSRSGDERTPGPWRGTGILGTTARTNKSEQWGNDLVTGNNLLALYGVENIGGFEAIIPRHYVAFSDAAGSRISPAGRTLQFTKFDSPLLDFAGLRHVLSAGGSGDAVALPPAGRLRHGLPVRKPRRVAPGPHDPGGPDREGRGGGRTTPSRSEVRSPARRPSSKAITAAGVGGRSDVARLRDPRQGGQTRDPGGGGHRLSRMGGDHRRPARADPAGECCVPRAGSPRGRACRRVPLPPGLRKGTASWRPFFFMALSVGVAFYRRKA
jgi:hypothetical protein